MRGLRHRITKEKRAKGATPNTICQRLDEKYIPTEIEAYIYVIGIQRTRFENKMNKKQRDRVKINKDRNRKKKKRSV